MTPRSLLAPARLAGQPVLRTQSDERLVDLVRAGSEPAFEAIVARYRRALLRYCTRILPEERAEDAVQQTFVRAYDAMRRNDAELKLRPWLYRIAHNTALNALRERGFRDEALDENLDGVEQPDQALERAQGLRSVLAAVQKLPKRQRDAIVLREFEGRSYDEIASELGVTGSAVRQLLNRARHAVRRAASAVTPVGLLLRGPFAAHSERAAELSGAGAAGGGAIVAKVCATALVTGAVVGGAAVAPKDQTPPAKAKEAPTAERRAANAAGAGGSAMRADTVAEQHSAVRTRTVSSRGEARRHRGSGKRESADGDDHGGERGGHGGRDEELTMRRDSSGPGSGKDDSGSGHSGSGHSGSGDGGSEESGGGPGPSIAETPELDRHSGSGSSGSGDSGSDGSSSGSSGGGLDDSLPEPASD